MEIWKDAVGIAVDVYKITETGKISKDYGLKDQLRRAAMSISDNIAEGFEYDNNKDFIKFLRYSKGSAGELRNKMFVLNEMEYIPEEYYSTMKERLLLLSRKIGGFIKY